MQGIIEVKPIETKEVQAETTNIEKVLLTAKDVKIKNQEGYDSSASLLSKIKTKAKELDKKRKAITAPLDTAKKAVMELFRKPLIMLGEAESILKKGMIAYTTEQERIRREHEEKLRRQAEAEEKRKREALEKRAKKAEEDGKAEKAEELREKAEEVRVEAPVLAQTTETPKGVSYREKWHAVVIDKTQLPIEYLEPNMQMLNKFAEATKGKVALSGVKFKSEKIVSSRI